MATLFNADYLTENGKGADTSVLGAALHHAASAVAAGLLGVAMVLAVGVGLVGAGAYAVYEPIALYRRRRHKARG
jgi:hypothetical protein